jgi:hypothetical protein
MSNVVRHHKGRAGVDKKERQIKRDTTLLLARFNTPELLNRRSVAIAEANASHTKKSDDALENILMEFEKL